MAKLPIGTRVKILGKWKIRDGYFEDSDTFPETPITGTITRYGNMYDYDVKIDNAKNDCLFNKDELEVLVSVKSQLIMKIMNLVYSYGDSRQVLGYANALRKDYEMDSSFDKANDKFRMIEESLKALVSGADRA